MANTIRFQRPNPPSKFNDSMDLFGLVSYGQMTEIFELFSKFVQEDVDFCIGQRDAEGRNLIHYGSFLDQTLITLFLMTYQGNPFDLDYSGRNSFHFICYKGNFQTGQMILQYEFAYHRMQLWNGLNALKVQHGIGGTLLSNTADRISMTASFKTDQQLKDRKIRFNIDLANLLEQYFRDLKIAYEAIFVQADSNGRNSLHYGSLNQFTWCYKTMQYFTILDNKKGYLELLDFIKELTHLESSVSRIIDPRKYDGVEDQVSRILPHDIYKKIKRNFIRSIKDIMKRSVSMQDNQGKTPLHIASANGDYNSVKLFIKLGASKDVTDQNGNTALQVASKRIVMRYLSSLEETVHTKNGTAFAHLVDSGYNVNHSTSEFMVTSVHKATVQANGMLESVLQAEGSTEVVEWNLYTPLHYACQSGNFNEAEILLGNGAKVDARSQYKLTPLHLAAQNNHQQIVSLLIQHNAKINAKDHQKCTPLHLAAKKGALEALKFLLLKKANIYAQDFRHWTPLHYASFNNQHLVVKELIRWDSDYNKLIGMKSTQNKTAFAITSDPKTQKAFTTIWSAASKGDLDTCRILVNQGQDINAQTEFRQITPLMFAIKNNHVLVVKYLIRNGADLELYNVNGKTAMDYVDKFGDNKIRQALIKAPVEERKQPVQEVRRETSSNLSGLPSFKK